MGLGLGAALAPALDLIRRRRKQTYQRQTELLDLVDTARTWLDRL